MEVNLTKRQQWRCFTTTFKNVLPVWVKYIKENRLGIFWVFLEVITLPIKVPIVVWLCFTRSGNRQAVKWHDQGMFNLY